MRDKNKFRGCLVGGAIGDALGYTVEFMSYDALFTANGLLIRTTRGMNRGIADDLWHDCTATEFKELSEEEWKWLRKYSA
ncbi:hypothetical protein FACS189447_05630 [Spirochaetia bacterium]|nr:hypothetical protein FACS189447_05630 [Spirochaetia bacterium]